MQRTIPVVCEILALDDFYVLLIVVFPRRTIVRSRQTASASKILAQCVSQFLLPFREQILDIPRLSI